MRIRPALIECRRVGMGTMMAFGSTGYTTRLGYRASVSSNSKGEVRVQWRCGCITFTNGSAPTMYQPCAKHERRSVSYVMETNERRSPNL